MFEGDSHNFLRYIKLLSPKSTRNHCSRCHDANDRNFFPTIYVNQSIRGNLTLQTEDTDRS